jgi:exodeoxyribonuclease-1
VGKSFFFYDLETSGLNPKEDRVMQFAGQRTDEGLNLIGQPFSYLIKLTQDVLPDPQAILVTGITPQQTLEKGLTEAAFLSIFHEQIATSGTIFIGYNNIHFDDEFIRYLNYRNFYDPYEWQWQGNRSRWDLLNVIRMMRALRPDGIKWPVDTGGKPVNSLEELTAANGLEHVKAHDALSDVTACIALAQLVRQTQPRLFAYLLNFRDKREIAQLVTGLEPFVYAGADQDEYDKTSVYSFLFELSRQGAAALFDLRYDPLDFTNLTATELAERWYGGQDYRTKPNPVRIIRYNRCPPVAPLTVLDEISQSRLKLDPETITRHRHQLKKCLPSWQPTLQEALSLSDEASHKSRRGFAASVDTLLYEKFFDDNDKRSFSAVRATPPAELAIAKFNFTDRRLRRLLPLYKARNYPESLTEAEQRRWHDYCQRHLMQGGPVSRYANFVIRLQSLAETDKLSTRDQKLLTELDGWAHQLMPIDGLHSAKLGQ